MKKKQENLTPKFDQGKLLFSWESYEYFPFARGKVWMAVFYVAIFGTVLLSLIIKDWIMAFAFFVAGIMSVFFLHKTPRIHQIDIYENYLHVGNRYYAWNDFIGYWFVYDERQAVAVINFEFKKGQNKKLSLQMADLKPDDFKEVLSQVEIIELEDKKESLMDLWSRVLKL